MSKETSTTAGGDGLGPYSSGSGSAGGGRGSVGADSNALKAAVDSIAVSNATATTLSRSLSASISARIYSLIGAKTKEEKGMVDMVLVYYFGVHGTSPDTDWVAYGVTYPVVCAGGSYKPFDIVQLIGQHRLKKYLGQHTMLAMEMVEASDHFRSALRERAVRAGLAVGQEFMAIDFVGKDGSLSFAELQQRAATRENSLNYRSRNAHNVSELRAESARPDHRDARSLSGGGRPLMTFES